MMENNTKIFILLGLFALSSCSLVNHRDYMEIMDPQFAGGEPMFRPFEDFDVVPGDQGGFMDQADLVGRVPATADMRERQTYQNSIRRELFSLETRLGDMDYEEYMQVKGLLGSDYERIYYLRLHPSERAHYLGARGIVPKRYFSAQEAMRSPASQGISLGMERSDVIGQWGEPQRRDYAGNPVQGNERWAYTQNGQVKYIYFEGGRVEGWSEQ